MSKRGRMNKKGISPLIATALIIGFVIALSAIFWIFFSGTVTEQLDKQGAESDGKTKCLGVEVAFEKCSDGFVEFKNNGKQDLAGFTLRVNDGSGGARAVQDYTSLRSGDSEEYNTRVAGTPKGSAIPIVSAKGYAYPCADKIVSFDCSQ